MSNTEKISKLTKLSNKKISIYYLLLIMIPISWGFLQGLAVPKYSLWTMAVFDVRLIHIYNLIGRWWYIFILGISFLYAKEAVLQKRDENNPRRLPWLWLLVWYLAAVGVAGVGELLLEKLYSPKISLFPLFYVFLITELIALILGTLCVKWNFSEKAARCYLLLVTIPCPVTLLHPTVLESYRGVRFQYRQFISASCFIIALLAHVFIILLSCLYVREVALQKRQGNRLYRFPWLWLLIWYLAVMGLETVIGCFGYMIYSGTSPEWFLIYVVFMILLIPPMLICYLLARWIPDRKKRAGNRAEASEEI